MTSLSSANQTLQPGEYAICIDYWRVRPDGPRRADLVVVQKRRATNEHKTFIARLHHCENAWELRFESTDQRWQGQSILLSEDLTRDTFDNCNVEIVGYVLGVFRANPQPLPLT